MCCKLIQQNSTHSAAALNFFAKIFTNLQANSHNLNDTLLVQLTSLSTPAFFVENVPEVQVQAIKLLPLVLGRAQIFIYTIFIFVIG